jgi:hypothetical protein
MHVYSDLQLEDFSGIIFTTNKRTRSSDLRAINNNRNRGTYNEMNFYIIILVHAFKTFIPLSLEQNVLLHG